jgi:hypothetical protein
MSIFFHLVYCTVIEGSQGLKKERNVRKKRREEKEKVKK